MPGRDLRWWLREALLSLGAVVGCVCLIAAVASVVFGVRPLIFRSGSMAPAIGSGALGVAREVDAQELRVGDVVSVIDDRGLRITHRIVQLEPEGAATALVLKGDANRLPDGQPYQVQRADRLLFAIPLVGYVIAALSSPWMSFVGGALVGSLLVIAFRPTGRGGDAGRRSGSGRGADPPGRPRRHLVEPRLATTVVIGVVLALVHPRIAAAAFVDTAQVSSGNLSTATRVPAPVLTCTALGVASVRFTWTAVTGATNYELAVTGSTPSTTVQSGLTLTINGLLGSGTATVRARVVYPSTVWLSNPSNTVRYGNLVVTTCGPA